jgi:ribosome-binding factor A
MREEIDEMVSYELADPRLSSTRISEVHVSPDSRHARIAVVVAGGKAGEAAALQALEKARHYIRRHLAERLDLFRVPELHFELAAELDPERLKSLLKRMRKGRPRDEAPADAHPEPAGGEKNPLE